MLRAVTVRREKVSAGTSFFGLVARARFAKPKGEAHAVRMPDGGVIYVITVKDAATGDGFAMSELACGDYEVEYWKMVEDRA